ncbi:MAG: hypothetical protein HY882_06430 [Deltaproteobacteria bacterium]|nr:hypothetical protein [Deltaproteobacteria bacterium]
MAEKKIEVLNPVGEVEVKTRKLAPRPQSLQGLRLGLLDNSKHNADHFLIRAGQRLKEKFGLGEILVQKKPNASVPVPQDAQNALLSCNFLITAFGD